MMIVRMWRGVTRAQDRDAYLEYFRRTGDLAYRWTPGNQGVEVLCHTEDGHSQFTILSFWDSWDAIRSFAGDDPTRAVFFPEDERFFVEADPRVTHHELLLDEHSRQYTG